MLPKLKIDRNKFGQSLSSIIYTPHNYEGKMQSTEEDNSNLWKRKKYMINR